MHEPGELDLASFTEEEQLALGGLVRLMMHIDGEVSFEERIVLAFIANRFGDHDAFYRVIDAAEGRLPSEEAVREAAHGVTRPETRALFRELLLELAQQNGVEATEEALLDWLDRAWGM